MKQNVYKGEWCASSTPLHEKMKELQEAHRHFEQMVVSGEIKIDVPVVTKARRNRIMVEKFKTVTVWGKEMRISIDEYKTHYLKANLK